MLSHTGCRIWRALKRLRCSWGTPYRTYKLDDVRIAQSPLSPYPWAGAPVSRGRASQMSLRAAWSLKDISCVTDTLGGPGQFHAVTIPRAVSYALAVVVSRAG